MAAPGSISGPTPASPRIAIARLGVVTGRGDQVSEWVDVHFNPASLQLQISNELKDTANNERKQYIAKSNAKLTMELTFDTTGNGNDVTETTRKLQAFIAPARPPGQEASQQTPPPAVLFEWGRTKFKGIAEAYKETIDFFSASGVPLRSSITLTLSRQDQVFEDAPGSGPDPAGPADDTLSLSPESAAAVANAGQAPGAARALAAANGQENLRFGSGASLSVSAQISLKPPAAFASGGIGIGGGLGIEGGVGGGVGISLGAGISAGISAGASAGAGIGAGAGAGVGISGLARLSATEGAFAGLRVTGGSTASVPRVNASQLVPQLRSAQLTTDRNALFQVGGKATVEGVAGLRADVGARGGLAGKLTFD